MRIIIIRHAEPDYPNNCITKNGEIEALALKERLLKEKLDYIYISPLNRAYLTAKPYLDETHKEYKTCDWLTEFDYKIYHDDGRYKIPWDFHIDDLSKHKKIYDYSTWLSDPILNDEYRKGYKYVTDEFNKLLAKHGYVKEDKYFRVEKSNKDTLVFFCHLGLESVLLSDLFSIPAPIIAEYFGPAPSSVSVLYSEERKDGIAHFRAQCLGDLSHLYVKGITPSFAGRFQENYFDNGRKE